MMGWDEGLAAILAAATLMMLTLAIWMVIE